VRAVAVSSTSDRRRSVRCWIGTCSNGAAVATKPSRWGDRSTGSPSRTRSPSFVSIVSVTGSKSKEPAKARATTISGEARNDLVVALPSLRRAKFRLKLETMLLNCVGSMQLAVPLSDAWPAGIGEHGGANTSEITQEPSRSTVARICSEPGVTKSGTLAESPSAWRASRRRQRARCPRRRSSCTNRRARPKC
jgi:hypothetical protein